MMNIVMKCVRRRKTWTPISKLNFSAGGASGKVAVVGAAGGIGQPLSMLLKLSGEIEHLSLYDLRGTPGIAADLSHCSSNGTISGHQGPEEMHEALLGSDIVIIPAGVPRQPGMSRDDLFNKNAGIVAGIAKVCASACPAARCLIISNPVNAMVPIFAEILKKEGVYDPRKIMGVTTLDISRAETFVAQSRGLDVNNVSVNVIGGHAGTTILPLLSQVEGVTYSQDEVEALTHRIQFGGDEVVKAKAGTGSATLSMAYAGSRFALRVLDAMKGKANVVECTYVENNLTVAPFFATPCLLGEEGVQEVRNYGKLSDFEQKVLDENVPALKSTAQKGVDYVKNNA